MTTQERLEQLKALRELFSDLPKGHDQTVRTRAIRIMIADLDLPGTKETEKFLEWCIRLLEGHQADRFIWTPAHGVEGD